MLEHSKALQELKLDLIHAFESQLRIIRLDQPFGVFINASANAVGDLLGQRNDWRLNTQSHLYSSKLTPAKEIGLLLNA